MTEVKEYSVGKTSAGKHIPMDRLGTSLNNNLIISGVSSEVVPLQVMSHCDYLLKPSGVGIATKTISLQTVNLECTKGLLQVLKMREKL